MKKHFLALILSITVSAACLTGCGSAPASDNVASETTDTGASAVTDTATDPDTSAESAADKMFVQKKGNHVFFVMTPDSFGNN